MSVKGMSINNTKRESGNENLPSDDGKEAGNDEQERELGLFYNVRKQEETVEGKREGKKEEREKERLLFPS